MKCLGFFILKLNLSSLSPRRRPHHRTARARSISAQSTLFHLQTSSQLTYKHDPSSDCLGTLLIVAYIAVAVKKWCRLSLVETRRSTARAGSSLVVVVSSTNEPKVAPIFHIVVRGICSFPRWLIVVLMAVSSCCFGELATRSLLLQWLFFK